jgi:hypothetical protein
VRTLLIHLTSCLLQALLLYAAYRLCRSLLKRTFVGKAKYGQSDVMVARSLPSPQFQPRQYCLPAKASDRC